MARDPVCGMNVDEQQAAATAKHNGTTCYFCSPGCKKALEKDPHKYRHDSADPAAVSVCGKNHTVEPTYTAIASLLDIALNQRATFRWVAAPGSELMAPATAANGIGLQCQGVGGSGVAVIATVLFAE